MVHRTTKQEQLRCYHQQGRADDAQPEEDKLMEQDLHTWAVEARANGNRTDQPDELAARWFDLADDLDALLAQLNPKRTS